MIVSQFHSSICLRFSLQTTDFSPLARETLWLPFRRKHDRLDHAGLLCSLKLRFSSKVLVRVGTFGSRWRLGGHGRLLPTVLLPLLLLLLRRRELPGEHGANGNLDQRRGGTLLTPRQRLESIPRSFVGLKIDRTAWGVA
jgi:hypothetical protein